MNLSFHTPRYAPAVIVALLFLAAQTNPIAAYHVGGLRVILSVVFVCLLLGQYKRDDIPFTRACSQMAARNRLMLFLLGWYYLGVIFGMIRGGVIHGFEWKFHASSLTALANGFFLARNPKYRRIMMFLVVGLMVGHAIFAKRYVDATGLDMRAALSDVGGALGHTDFWTNYAMLTLLFLGLILEERIRWIKYVGILMLAYFYRAILFCGFATPVALFIIGHILLSVVMLRFNKKKGVIWVARLVLAACLIVGAVKTVQKIAALEGDTRFTSIQVRFKNIIDNPEGGGYSVEQSRFNLARVSWATFKRHPLIGCGSTYMDNLHTGGHQAVVDFLALYGILGGGGAFIAFVLICLANGYRRCRCERTWTAFCSFAGVGMFAIVGVVNPGWLGGPLSIMLLLVHPYNMIYPRPRQLEGLPGRTLDDGRLPPRPGPVV